MSDETHYNHDATVAWESVEDERARCLKIATDMANSFKVGTVEGDISYAVAMAIAKLIEAGE